MPERLLASSAMSGKGLDRHEISAVCTLEGRVVARLGPIMQTQRSGSEAHDFIAGRNACHAARKAVHPDTMEIASGEGGTGIFRSPVHTLSHDGTVLYSSNRIEGVRAYAKGWTYALKELGLLSRSGRLRPDAG